MVSLWLSPACPVAFWIITTAVKLFALFAFLNYHIATALGAFNSLQLLGKGGGVFTGRKARAGNEFAKPTHPDDQLALFT